MFGSEEYVEISLDGKDESGRSFMIPKELVSFGGLPLTRHQRQGSNGTLGIISDKGIAAPKCR